MIRKAIEQDIPRLLELLHQVNRVHHTLRPDLFKPHATKYDEQQLRQILADESKAVFVYEEASVLGYAFVEIEATKDDRLLQDRRTLYVDDLCVDEKARNRHIGRQLFDHVRAYARSQGCDSITLNVWDGNKAAWAFYQRMGMHVRKTCMELDPGTPSPEPVQQAQTKKRIEVVAAIIRDEEGCIFATQRGYGEWKDWWEFPGGKMEAGEAAQQALKREIHEELDAEIEVGELMRTIEYDYPAFHLTMHCFLCRLTGRVTLLEHEAAKWLAPSELNSVKWLPADEEIIEELKNRK